MQTIEFHSKEGGKYFLAPDFTSIALSDESPISGALDAVLRAKKKSVLRAERDGIIREIERVAKGETVGALRAMEDDMWAKLDLPLICRVYLKNLILQSCSLTHQQLLECDFNSGLEFKWPKDKVEQLLALGFARNESLEAILVTDNKQVELAAQYLLADEENRKLEYERAKRKRNIYVPPDHHHTVIVRLKKAKKQTASWSTKTENQLVLEVMRLKNQLKGIRNKRTKLEEQRDEVAKSSRLALYAEYLRGLTADPTLNSEELQHMERYRRPRKITNEDHLQVLPTIGFDEKRFDSVKTYGTSTNEEDECVVCYEPPKDHMILPCNHVCLCQECADENFPQPHDEQTCPLCSCEVESVKQVYYF